MAGADLRLGLMRERPVDHVQEPVVLPEADAESDPDDHERQRSARAHLVEMTDGGEPVLWATVTPYAPVAPWIILAAWIRKPSAREPIGRPRLAT